MQETENRPSQKQDKTGYSARTGRIKARPMEIIQRKHQGQAHATARSTQGRMRQKKEEKRKTVLCHSNKPLLNRQAIKQITQPRLQGVGCNLVTGR
jgi:hypothetical protein